MNYTRQYEDRTNWQNRPSTNTPLNAANLNKMDAALQYIDGKLAEAAPDIGISAISDLTDVNLTSLADNNILRFSSSQNKWINDIEHINTYENTQSGSTSYISVSGFKFRNGDFVVIHFANALTLSGSYWQISGGMTMYPIKKQDGSYFTDNISAGDYLILAVNSTGSCFVVVNEGSGASALSDLTDTNISSPTNGQVLGYNNISGKWENIDNEPEYGLAYCFNLMSMGTESGNTREITAQVGSYYDKNGLFIINTTSLDGSTNSTWTLVLQNTSTTPWTSKTRVLKDPDLNNWTSDIEENTALVIDVDGNYAVVRGVLRYNEGIGASALSDLTDTSISTPTNGQALVYDGTASKWKNQTISVGVTDVAWDSTNKKLKQTKNGSTTDIVTGSTILDGLTSSQVTTALGYTPPQQDTNTHRPIQVNGTQVLGDNVTPLNLVAGANVTLTESSGSVQISASGGGGGGATMSKTRYLVQTSSWSSTVDEDGYYELTLSLSPTLDPTYSPNIYLAGAGTAFYEPPTDTQIEQFDLLDKAFINTGNVITLYAKIKPTSNFYIWVEGAKS